MPTDTRYVWERELRPVEQKKAGSTGLSDLTSRLSSDTSERSSVIQEINIPIMLATALSRGDDTVEAGCELGPNYDVQDNDVYCGPRGTKELDRVHPGNKKFKAVVSLSCKRYRKAESRTEKSSIVKEIVDTVRGYGGRFVKRKHGVWHDIGNTKARDKASTAIRIMLGVRRQRRKLLAKKKSSAPTKKNGKQEEKEDYGKESNKLEDAEMKNPDEPKKMNTTQVGTVENEQETWDDISESCLPETRTRNLAVAARAECPVIAAREEIPFRAAMARNSVSTATKRNHAVASKEEPMEDKPFADDVAESLAASDSLRGLDKFVASFVPSQGFSGSSSSVSGSLYLPQGEISDLHGDSSDSLSSSESGTSDQKPAAA